MKTSAFIEIQSAQLHQLLDSNRSAAHRPDFLDELDGITEYISDFYPPSTKEMESLMQAARLYYGPDAHVIKDEERVSLAKEMRTAILLLASQSTVCRRNGD